MRRPRSSTESGLRGSRRDLPVEVYEAPELGVPLLQVSTLDGYEPGLAEIAAFLR